MVINQIDCYSASNIKMANVCFFLGGGLSELTGWTICSLVNRMVVYCITVNSLLERELLSVKLNKGKGKGHPCTGTEALYRPYGP